jgi:hypothetical protein
MDRDHEQAQECLDVVRQALAEYQSMYERFLAVEGWKLPYVHAD